MKQIEEVPAKKQNSDRSLNLFNEESTKGVALQFLFFTSEARGLTN